MIAALLASVIGATPATVVSRTEPDGLDLLIVKPLPGAQCAARLIVRAGANDDPPGREGLAHLLEHLVFRGQRGQELIKQVAATGDVNARTSFDATVFELETDPEHCALHLESFLATITDPELRRSWIEKEVQVIDREQIYSPGASRGFLESATFGKPLVLGTRSTRDRVTREDLLGFLEKHYVPANMALVIASNSAPGELLGAIGRGFRAPPSLPATRPFRALPLLKTPIRGPISDFRGGAAVAAVVLPGSGITECRYFAALLEYRAARAVAASPARGSTVYGACLVLHGHLLLMLLATGVGAENEQVAAQLLQQVESARKPPTAVERALVSRRLVNDALVEGHDSARTVDRIAEATVWAAGDEFFNHARKWLEVPQLSPGAATSFFAEEAIALKSILISSPLLLDEER